MKWEMEVEEVEAALEKTCDLHDKISDAIHEISRAHFLSSVKADVGNRPAANPGGRFCDVAAKGGMDGYVFVKELGIYVDDAAVTEARSLTAIRNALENLEDQLEFFHTVQSHQRAERDAAIARLEQSRIILAMRLADHHGKNYKVIEEALAFVGDVRDARHFGASEHLSERATSQSSDNMEINNKKKSSILRQILASGVTIAKKSIFSGIGEILGNATLFTISMLAIFQLHSVVFKSDVLHAPKQEYSSKKKARTSHDNHMQSLDVLSGRG